MRKTILIFMNTLRNGKLMLVLALLSGGLLCVFLNYIITTESNSYSISVGLVDRDNSELSDDFSSYLADGLSMRVDEGGEAEYMKTELVEKHISTAVIIPEGFERSVIEGKPIPLETIYTDDYENVAFTQAYLEAYSASLAIISGATGGDSERFWILLNETATREISIENSPASEAYKALGGNASGTAVGDPLSTQHQESLRAVEGFYLMLSFVLALFIATALCDERADGRYSRLRITGARPLAYLAAVAAYGLIGVLLIVAPLFLYLRHIGLYVLPTGQSLALHIAYGIFVVAFAIFTGLYLKSRPVIIACIVGVVTIANLCGGSWFHISLAPLFMRALARITPQFWFIDAYDTAIGGDGFGSSWWQSLIILVLYALLFFLLSGIRFVHDKALRRG
jgi:ABC-2 type transport system permease protein